MNCIAVIACFGLLCGTLVAADLQQSAATNSDSVGADSNKTIGYKLKRDISPPASTNNSVGVNAGTQPPNKEAIVADNSGPTQPPFNPSSEGNGAQIDALTNPTSIIPINTDKSSTETPTTHTESTTTPAEKPTPPAEKPTPPTEKPTTPTEKPTTPAEKPTPPTVMPTTSTENPTPTENSTSATVTTPASPSSSISPPITSPKAPVTTVIPSTAKPANDRRFDGPSFIGGIVFALGVTAIAFVAWKFYKARTERNYHTL